MSTRSNSPSYQHEFTHDYIQDGLNKTLSSTRFSTDCVELYNGPVEESSLKSFLGYCGEKSSLEGYDMEEPQLHIDWYSDKEESGRLEAIIERKYVSDSVPEELAETVPKIPFARDFLYNETVEYEKVEDVEWEEAMEKLEKAGIKPASSEL